MRLGEGIDWGFGPVEPPEPTADERRHFEVLSALTALRDALAALDHPEPVVHVDAADLTPLIDVLRAAQSPSTPPLDADRIAAAIAAALPRSDDSVGTVLGQVAEQLQRMNKKVTAMSVMPSGGSSGHVIVDSGNLALSQPVDVLDRSGRDVGRVTVTNPTANPETGLAKDATVGAVRDRLPTALDPDGGLAVHLVNAPARVQEITVEPVGTRIASFNGAPVTNASHFGLVLHVNVTAASGVVAPTLDIKVQSQDAVSGAWADVAAAATVTISAPGIYTVTIYPGLSQTAAGNAVRSSNVLGRRWRLVHTIAGTDPSFTYSVGGTYLP